MSQATRSKKQVAHGTMRLESAATSTRRHHNGETVRDDEEHGKKRRRDGDGNYEYENTNELHAKEKMLAGSHQISKRKERAQKEARPHQETGLDHALVQNLQGPDGFTFYSRLFETYENYQSLISLLKSTPAFTARQNDEIKIPTMEKLDHIIEGMEACGIQMEQEIEMALEIVSNDCI
ncbi:hypothetical protein AC578_6123 [Pseudocercospora eumusae]|uniref:Uncharacterized protein n=1 Tax=Pseudocercospora eumusae TaxID=321146 RepID=A0A139GUE6_9PEZI|nr:hypothetical protein AC578_6123 [Pseudocercospora eumusae]